MNVIARRSEATTKQSDRKVGWLRFARYGVFLGTLLFCFTCYDAAADTLFQQANAKYKAGEFKDAADLYGKSIETGRAGAAVHYNLGNALLRTGDKGQALLQYERALRISPRDRDIRWNIRVLKAALQDKIEDSTPFPVSMLRQAAGYLRSDEAAWLVTISLAWLALTGVWSWLSPASRPAARFFRALGLVALVFSCTASFLSWIENREPKAVVLDKEAPAYYGPSERETKAFVLHEGAEGKVVDQTQDWYFLQLANGSAGWVRKNTSETV